MNKYYNKVRYSKKFEMYDFEFFDVEKIGFFYGDKKKYRIGKFISLIYKKCIRSRNKEDRSYLNRNGFVYVSKREIEDLLGIRDNLKLIRSLSKSGLIKYRREGRSKYDYNKKFYILECLNIINSIYKKLKYSHNTAFHFKSRRNNLFTYVSNLKVR